MTSGAALTAFIAGASPLLTIAIGAGGFLSFIGAAFLVSLVLAPVRQRNEARAEVRRLTVTPQSDPRGLAREFSEWLLAKRAAVPTWPDGRGGVRSDDPALAVYKETQREVQRHARLEYHEQFRPGVISVLGEGSTQQAHDPQTIEDLEAVEQLLLREAGP